MVKVVSQMSQREVEATNVDFDPKGEPWSTYDLSDGTVLKLRTTITGIQRLEGEYDAGGNPVYQVQSATMIRVVSADKKYRGTPTVGPPRQSPASAGGPEVR